MADPLYCSKEDLDVPQGTLDDASDEDVTRAITRASREADSYLQGVFDLPLTSWGEDLRGHVASMATWFVMKKIGFNPEDEDAQTIRQAYKDATDWLRDVRAGKALPINVRDSAPSEDNTTEGSELSHPLVLTNRPGAIVACGADDDFLGHDSPAGAGGLRSPSSRGW